MFKLVKDVEGLLHDILIEDSRFKFVFIRQQHNTIYNQMNENKIRLETSTKEQIRTAIIDATFIFMSVDFRA